MNETLLILAMAVITFAIRYTLFALAGKAAMPYGIKQALNYVPPTVLMAIVVPAVLMPEGEIDLSLHNPYLLGAIAAVVIALWSRSLLTTIALGMAIFLVLKHWVI